MSTPVISPDRHAGYKKSRLFFVSCLALTMAGINASLRSNTGADIEKIFLQPIDKVHSGTMIGNVLAVPFLGFAITIAVGSPLLDYIGMGFLLPMSGVLLSIGMLLMMFAGSLASGAEVYNILWIGAAAAGVGWGLVETCINPLIATLYPDNKTGKLNSLHAWWPGGLVIGGLLGDRQQTPALDVNQVGRHHHKFPGDIKVQDLEDLEVLKVLLRDPLNRDVVNVNFVLFDQIEQQIERPFKDLELHLVFVLHGNRRAYASLGALGQFFDTFWRGRGHGLTGRIRS